MASFTPARDVVGLISVVQNGGYRGGGQWALEPFSQILHGSGERCSCLDSRRKESCLKTLWKR